MKKQTNKQKEKKKQPSNHACTHLRRLCLWPSLPVFVIGLMLISNPDWVKGRCNSVGRGKKTKQQQPKKRNLNEVTVDNGQTVHIPGECSASTNAKLEELIVNSEWWMDLFTKLKKKKKRGGGGKKPNVQNLQILVLEKKKVSIDESKIKYGLNSCRVIVSHFHKCEF